MSQLSSWSAIPVLTHICQPQNQDAKEFQINFPMFNIPLMLHSAQMNLGAKVSIRRIHFNKCIINLILMLWTQGDSL